jgi:DNA-directed RNA polymerase subunit L
MIVNTIKNEKNELRVEMDNLTVAELLRKFLTEDSSVTFAAWRREHPTKNPMLTIKTDGKTAKKALLDAIEKVQKLNSEVTAEFKKVVKK